MSEAEADVVSDSEVHKLCLFSYLASENGVSAINNVIARGAELRCETSISAVEAEIKADIAKIQLGRLNLAVVERSPFQDLDSPSPRNSSLCSCMPFCGPFWTEVQPDWYTDCGVKLEWVIVMIESREFLCISLTTLLLSRQSREVSSLHMRIEQFPDERMKFDDIDLPNVGGAFRRVHVLQKYMADETAVTRVDMA